MKTLKAKFSQEKDVKENKVGWMSGFETLSKSFNRFMLIKAHEC